MVELELLGVSHTEGASVPVVLLRHEDRILPILVTLEAATAIHWGMRGEKATRPMTHDLISNLLAGLRADVKSVTVYKLENDTFFAHLNIEQMSVDGQVQQVLRVDARSSDAIAIATRVHCPIYAANEVMDLAAQKADFSGPEDGDDEVAEDFEA